MHIDVCVCVSCPNIMFRVSSVIAELVNNKAGISDIAFQHIFACGLDKTVLACFCQQETVVGRRLEGLLISNGSRCTSCLVKHRDIPAIFTCCNATWTSVGDTTTCVQHKVEEWGVMATSSRMARATSPCRRL